LKQNLVKINNYKYKKIKNKNNSETIFREEILEEKNISK